MVKLISIVLMAALLNGCMAAVGLIPTFVGGWLAADNRRQQQEETKDE